MDVLKDYDQLCKLVATGEPITSDRLPTQNDEPLLGPAQLLGNGYQFRRQTRASNEYGRIMEVATSLFAIMQPTGNLLLITWADWNDTGATHQACVKYDVSPDALATITERRREEQRMRETASSRFDADFRVKGVRMMDSVIGAPYGSAWHTFPFVDEYHQLMARVEALIGIGAEESEDQVNDRPPRAIESCMQHAFVVDQLKRNAYLCLLADDYAELIKPGDFGKLLSWISGQPETAAAGQS